MRVSTAIPFSTDLADDRGDRSGAVALTLACVVFTLLSAFLALKSQSDLEADATTHFLMARFAAHEHHYFVSVWGRPMCTAAYTLAARIGTVEEGRYYSRLTSLAMALIVTAITYSIGRRQGYKWPALVAICLLAQPIFFLHSFSELTEVPFALVLMLAFLAYQRKQWSWMAALTGLLPLGRPEGFGFILMAAAALVAHRRMRWLPLLPLPFLAWNLCGTYVTTVPPVQGLGWLFEAHSYGWVFRNWPYSYRSTYGSGPLLSFVVRLPVLVSPLLFPFTLAGLALGSGVIGVGGLSPRRMLERWNHLSHELRCEVWIVLIPLSILLVHSLLWWKGLMGSNGELRYLVIVGPFFALLSARGWEWAWGKFGWTHPLLWAGLAALLPIAANRFYQVVPLQLYDDGYAAREVAAWYRADTELQADFPRIMPTPPGISYFLDLSQTDTAHCLAAGKQSVMDLPPGTLLVWDPIYGPSNSSADMCVTRDLIDQAGWIPYRTFTHGYARFEVFLSPKTMSGNDAGKWRERAERD